MLPTPEQIGLPTHNRKALRKSLPPTPVLPNSNPFWHRASGKASSSTSAPEENAGKLPPNLGLIYAIARKELETDKDKETKKIKEHEEPHQVAIRCIAGLYGISPDSPIAIVLGKRIIRANPVSWQKKKAPPAPISFLIVALGLLLGAGIGWLLSFGSVTLKLPNLLFLH